MFITKIKIIKAVFILLLFMFVFPCFVFGQLSDSEFEKSLNGIITGIKIPVFPDKDYFITDFGAEAGGKIDCTEAFRLAIEECNQDGGGRVIVPSGLYLSGPIHLKSNVNLHLEEGAIIEFTKDKSKYLPNVLTRWEGVECYNYSPCIYALRQTNIAITGKGIIDGAGSNENWWSWKGLKEYGWREGDNCQKESRDRLFNMAEKGIPVEERNFGDGCYLRPSLFQTYYCSNILIEGVTFKDSPMWFINPVLSNSIILRNVIIEGLGPNNDGFNPESSKNILVEDCYFNTGDDCIAIKSGRNADGRRINIPSENIVIRNCFMKEGHGGVVFGSEISGGVSNVFVKNCEMNSPNLDRAIRIKTNSIRGGIIENIFIRDLKIGEVKEAILKIDFHYEEGDKGNFTPTVRNIDIKNIKSQKSDHALWIRGYERSPIKRLYLENCEFNNVKEKDIIEYTDEIIFKNVILNGIEKKAHSNLIDKKNKSVLLADSFIRLHPDTLAYPTEKKSYKWNYEQGLVLGAFYKLWRLTDKREYFDYIKKNIDYYVEGNGNIKTYVFNDFNIDNISSGKILLNLYNETKDGKYLKAADTLRKQLKYHPRTESEGFWHKKIYPYQMWLDGLYMAEPFYSQYARIFSEEKSFDDIYRQFMLIRQHLYDEKTGLYYHGWDEKKEQKWADPIKGTSPNFWGRSIGWFMMAMVDVLDYLPENHEGRKEVLKIFQELSASLINFRDEKTKLWYQIIDKQDSIGNYIETSGSAMIIYSYAKGYNSGFLTKNYFEIARESFNSLIYNYVNEAKGEYYLQNTVSVGGLGGNPYRDGSFKYYLSEPIRENDFKGYGPLLLSAIEIEYAGKTTVPQRGINKKIGLDYYYNYEYKLNETKILERFHYTWEDKENSGFNEFGKLFMQRGAEISSITTAPDYSTLKNLSVYIIVDPDTPKESDKPNYINDKEVKAIEKWVKEGGVLLVMANDSGNCEFRNLNKLISKFGITLNEDRHNLLTGKEFYKGKFDNLPNHPLFNGVDAIYMKEISSMNLSQRAKAVLEKERRVFMAEAEYGKGFVFVIGDPWIYNEYIDNRKIPEEFQNLKAANNLVDYILGKSKEIKGRKN